MWDKVVRHFLLQPTKRGVYSLEPGDKLTPEFSSIEDLMDYYVTRREPFSTYKIRLFTPILRQVKVWVFFCVLCFNWFFIRTLMYNFILLQ